MNKLSLRWATTGNLDRLLPLVTACHQFESIELPDDKRRNSLKRLLNEPSFGGVWCIDNADRPIGYIALCFGYSIELGGRDAFIDEFYILPEERHKGVGGTVIELIKSIAADIGVSTLHLEVAQENASAQSFYQTHGFQPRSKYFLMSNHLSRSGQ